MVHVVCKPRFKEIKMAPSAPQVFNGVTPDQYARLAEKAKAAGIDIDGNSGAASKFGVEIAWNYVPTTQELTLQCLKTPFFMKASDVNAKIQSLVTQSLA
jgi:hypothetical protein